MDKFGFKTAELHFVTGLYHIQIAFVQNFVFTQFTLDEPDGQPRGVDGNI